MQSIDKILEFELFTLAGTVVNGMTILVFAVILILGAVLARIGERAVKLFLSRQGVRHEGSVAATGRLIHYAILAIAMSTALHVVGINLTALFAAGAFFAVAIGFAMQNITQNFVSGIILLTEQTIKPGDVLEVDGKMVKVKQLGIRSTVARTLDQEDLIIPNSVLVSSTVKNYTLKDSLYRLRSMVGVTYDSDMKRVRRVLDDTLRSLDWRDKSRDPIITMKEFGSSSVDWEVSVFITNPFGQQQIRSKMNEAIWFALKDAGIVIAFPQLDLHLDAPVVKAMQHRDGS